MQNILFSQLLVLILVSILTNKAYSQFKKSKTLSLDSNLDDKSKQDEDEIFLNENLNKTETPPCGMPPDIQSVC